MSRHFRTCASAILGLCLVALLLVGSTGRGATQTPFIVLQSTTSTQNAGLFDHLLPRFQAQTGIAVRVVAVGTGQALRNAANGDGDVVLVHAKPAELRFVSEGHGTARYDVMYNDFVIVGPAEDPAALAGGRDAVQALRRIAERRAVFASRGDDSGTHQMEQRLWATAGIDAAAASGRWYRETGSGMGATLNVAVGMGAYALTDRATWLAFGNKGDHQILVENDPLLFNQYGIIPVSSQAHPGVKADLAHRFVDWILSETGQAAIASFQIDGQQLFYPNARP
ncbi:MAG: substrate-binding domain-containing protein [Pseudomonadota bacterium]